MDDIDLHEVYMPGYKVSLVKPDTGHGISSSNGSSGSSNSSSSSSAVTVGLDGVLPVNFSITNTG